MGCGENLSSLGFWKALLAEFIGTLVLVFAGCASCVPSSWDEKDIMQCGNTTNTDTPSSRHTQIALTFGIAVATVVWSIAHVSGGHINPAVTMGMLVARKISIVKAVLYIAVQSIGAVCGAAIVLGISPKICNTELGYTTISKGVSVGQGFGTELVITFVLVFTVFASCDGRRKDLSGSIPLAIGLSVTLCHLFAIKYTGSSMNPARSFGPAVVGGKWDDHWVYWIAPICGGMIAGLLYELIFAVDASTTKMRQMCTADGPEEEDESLDQKPVNYVVKTDGVTGQSEFRL